MPAIETVTTPIVLREPDGSEKLVAACFPHPDGLLYLDLFWHRSTPQRAAHLLRGELRGDGPWRVGDARLRLLGCQNTDPHLQADFVRWQQYLQTCGDDYPPRAQIEDIARRLGASLPDPDRLA